MNPPHDGTALGLIETRGYVGLVNATDAAAKAANVEIQSIERASGGLVLVTLVGDVASVQVAVDAGAEAAAAVGNLVSSHVIPRPDVSVWTVLGARASSETEPKRPERRRAPAVPKPTNDLGDLPVRELRRRARLMEGIGLSGREISRAPKQQLIEAMRAAEG